MQNLGRLLLLLGVTLAIVGGIVLLLGRAGVGQVPGTVRMGSSDWGCYVPILGSILLSIVLTIVLNLLLRLFR